MTPDDLTVAVNAQLLSGSAGGIETNLLGLLAALDGLADGRQIVIGPETHSSWLQEYLGPRQTLLPWTVVSPRSFLPPASRHGVAAAARRWRGQLRRFGGGVVGGRMLGDRTDGAILTAALGERGVEVVHFPYQRWFPTTLPTLFEPWDLQHRHYPEFFSGEEIRLRDDLYTVGCGRARLVITASRWTKQDLVGQLAVDPRKIAVIPRGAAIRSRRRLPPAEAAARVRPLHLPARFVIYPAKTWPHKNHTRLFETLAHLRDRRGVVVPLVCTSRPVLGHWPIIQRSLEALALDKQVIFTGQVSQDQMDALFSLAEFLVFPSLFEGLGLPLLEAMHFGVPVVSSAVTCLPEIAGDAGYYFDPLSVESMADAIERVWQSATLREERRGRGAARVRSFSWPEAARRFEICYRHAAGRRLSPTETVSLEEMTS